MLRTQKAKDQKSKKENGSKSKNNRQKHDPYKLRKVTTCGAQCKLDYIHGKTLFPSYTDKPNIKVSDTQCRPNQQHDGMCRDVDSLKDEPRPESDLLKLPLAKEEEEKTKEFGKEMSKSELVLAAKNKQELGHLTNKLDNLV